MSRFILSLVLAGSASAFTQPKAKLARIRGRWSTPAAVADYSGAVASLFGNMRAPAALIGGSLVSLGMLGAPVAAKDDTPTIRALKKAYLVTAIISISGEIMAVVYATISINKLAETTVAPAASIVALIARDCELEWVGANVGFLGGLCGFVGLLGIRAWLAFGPAFGRFGALLCGAVGTHACSVVNRGIAAGDGAGVRHASNFLGLVVRYATLIVANAWRTRGPLRIISLMCLGGAAWTAASAARTEHGDDCPLSK